VSPDVDLDDLVAKLRWPILPRHHQRRDRSCNWPICAKSEYSCARL